MGVTDLDRSHQFYTALGWRGTEVQETVFFQAGPIALVLWDRGALADDAGVDDDGAAFGGIVLAHNVHTRAEVDTIIDQARAAGAVITREPAETFYGGYAACLADPDGHVWEVAHNPGFTLAPDGSLVLPDWDAQG
nr:VOC family protein [Salsipaludibacter albus]